jgi:hypothetical protein
VEDDLVLTRASHQSVTERGGEGYLFGILAGWAKAEMFDGPDLLPEAPF